MLKKKGAKSVSDQLNEAMPVGFHAALGVSHEMQEARAKAEESGFSRKADAMYGLGMGSGGVPRGPITYVDPMFDPILFLFPKDRIDEINKRLRHYYETDPIVGSAIDLHTALPLSDFYLECENKQNEQYWNDWKDRVGVMEFLRGLVHDQWLTGEGVGLPVWDDYNFEISHFNQYPPENVDIIQTYVTPRKFFMLKPDPKLREKVNSGNDLDKSIMMMMDQKYIDSLKEGKPYFLGSDEKVMYLARLTTKYRNRGISLLSRCLKDLLYKDRLRLLQTVIADRHMYPIKLFKLGSESRGWIPNKKHFDRLQSLLAQAQGDPDFPFSEDTQLLTEDGWKYYYEFSKFDKFATLNPETGAMEYHKSVAMHVRDYEGEMVHIESGSVDTLTTPEHWHWAQPVESKNSKGERISYSWRSIRAKDLTGLYRLRTTPDSWAGTLHHEDKMAPKIYEKTVSDVECEPTGTTLPAEIVHMVKIKSMEMRLDDFLRLSGFFISEGCVWNAGEKSTYTKRKWRIQIAQNADKREFNDIMSGIIARAPFKINKTDKKMHKKAHLCYGIYEPIIVEFMRDQFGIGVFNKHIPKWMKALPAKYLRILFDSLMLGDGTQHKKFGVPARMYPTSSKILMEDVREITLKLGWHSSISVIHPSSENQLTEKHYHVLIQSAGDRKCPRGAKVTLKSNMIKRVPYKGKIFCPTVPPNHLVFARRNGKVVISRQCLLYHFGLQVDYIGTKDKVANLVPEFEWIEKQLMAGLFVNEEMIHGGMPSAVRDTVNMRMLMYRYIDIREKVERMLTTHVFLPMARARGFYRKGGKAAAMAMEKKMMKFASGKSMDVPGSYVENSELFRVANSVSGNLDLSAYDIPRPIWKKMNLVNNAAEQQIMLNLEEEGKIPLEMVFDMLGLDPRVVKAKLEAQEGTVFDSLHRQMRDEIGKTGKIRKQVLMGYKTKDWDIDSLDEADAGVPGLGGKPPTGGKKPMMPSLGGDVLPGAPKTKAPSKPPAVGGGDIGAIPGGPVGKAPIPVKPAPTAPPPAILPMAPVPAIPASPTGGKP